MNSFVLFSTDEQEIKRLILELREDAATGVDQISGKIVKKYLTSIVVPMNHICNLSFATGVFPSAFKTALVKPIFKGGDKNNISNYRPISILPTLSKILERLIYKRLIDFLERNTILSQCQYGFRSGKSTDDAVHDLTTSIVSNLDCKKRSLTVFLDLAKAFDTVSIPILLQKLERIGVRGLPLKLMESYLSGRRQRVKVDNWISDELDLLYGVPQGSILGPSLFLVYINDLCQLQIPNGRILSFADDTALLFSGNSWEDVFQSTQSGFNRVNLWLKQNLLTLNASKTKYIAFAHKLNLLPPITFSVIAHSCTTTTPCVCPTIERTNVIKYLGVYMDQTLSFKPHIDVLVGRLRKLIYLFKCLRYTAHRDTIKMVYYSLCQSLINYCISSWGGATKGNLLEVERAQRAILKVGAGMPFRYPTTSLYKLWDVLTVRQIFIANIVTKKHSQLVFDPDLKKDKRRKGNVCPSELWHTSFSHRFYGFLGGYLYNKINTTLSIYPFRKSVCRKALAKYLKTLDYKTTEGLLTIIL